MSLLQNTVIRVVNHTSDTLHITNDKITWGHFTTPLPGYISSMSEVTFDAWGGLFNGIDFRFLCHLTPIRKGSVVCHCCVELRVSFPSDLTYQVDTLVDKANFRFHQHYNLHTQYKLIDKSLYCTVTFTDIPY